MAATTTNLHVSPANMFVPKVSVTSFSPPSSIDNFYQTRYHNNISICPQTQKKSGCSNIKPRRRLFPVSDSYFNKMVNIFSLVKYFSPPDADRGAFPAPTPAWGRASRTRASCWRTLCCRAGPAPPPSPTESRSAGSQGNGDDTNKSLVEQTCRFFAPDKRCYPPCRHNLSPDPNPISV